MTIETIEPRRNTFGALPERRYRLNVPAVAAQVADGEALLIHFDNGSYYSLNATATEMLQRLVEGKYSPAEVASWLTKRRDVAADVMTRAVGHFLGVLLDEQLVQVDDELSRDSKA